MLKISVIEDCALVSTSMVTGFKLRKDEEFLEANQTLSMSVIDSLLYVIASRPNIMKEVGLIVWFQATPK